MARPETVHDIEIQQIDFATVETDKINTNGPVLKAYATFMESLQKAGVHVDANGYGRVTFYRDATESEQRSQLISHQQTWDAREKAYNQLRDVGSMEHEYMRSSVEAWAKNEGLPWPPVHEPIDPIDAVIRDIDAVIRDIDAVIRDIDEAVS